MSTQLTLCHPTERRALTPDETTFVEQAAIAAMQGIVTRQSSNDEKQIAGQAWGQAFALLATREKLKKYIG